jgi:ribosomal protein S27E
MDAVMSLSHASPLTGSVAYARHRPEQTLLYQLVERHYPQFARLMAEQSSPLPGHVAREFEAYLSCGRLEHGFLRVRCESCHHEKLVAFSCKRRGFCPSCGARRMVDSAALLVDEVLPKVPLRQWVLSVPFQLRFLFASYPALMGKALGVVTRSITSWLIRQAGFTHDTARTGAVTFIQRFGSALNLNVHFHMLFLDGVYVTRCHDGDSSNSSQVFRRVNAPSKADLEAVLQQLSTRLARLLVKEGVLTQDIENSYLTLNHLEADPMQQVHGHSITYRIAIGPQQGKKVFTLQTLLPKDAEDGRFSQVAKAGGFSLHAGVAVQPHERKKLEHLCRYVARPAISEQRLALTRDGRVRYELKTPYRDGTTHVIFEPLDFIAKLADLVPKPRVNLTRFHGVFAPNSNYRVTITPGKRGKGARTGVNTQPTEPDDRSPMEQRAAMTWARRLKRVFNIDISECEKCKGPVKIIACIEDPIVIEKILNYLKAKEVRQTSPSTQLPPPRAPPLLPGWEQGLAN